MHFEKPTVTMRDKQKAKKTIKLFGFLAGAFTFATVCTIAFMPRAKTINGIDGKEKEIVTNYTALNDGKQFVILSDNNMQVYDVNSGKSLSKFAYVDEVLKKVNEKDGNNLPSSLFVDQTIHYEKIDDESGYVLLFDTFGDIFKLDYKQGVLTMSDSYYLTDRYELTTGDKKVQYTDTNKVRHLYVDNDDLYVLSANDNKFLLTKFALNDISSGIKNSKYLYNFREPSYDEQYDIKNAYDEKVYPITHGSLNYDLTPYYIADPISSNSAEPLYDIYMKDGIGYISTSNGVTKFSLDFNDFRNVSALKDAKDFYVNKMREEFKTLDPDTAFTKFGISNELLYKVTHGETSSFTVTSLFKTVYANEYFAKIKQYAAEDIEANDWLAFIDPTQSYKSHAIFCSAVDEDCKSFLINKGSELNMCGLIFAHKNDTMYTINQSDSTIYSIPLSALNSYHFNDKQTLYQNAVNTGVKYKNKEFAKLSTAIHYDPISQRLHVRFDNDKDLSLLEIKDDGIEILTTLGTRYDISTVNGNVDGSKTIIFYKTTKTTIKNVTTTPYHVDIIDPLMYQYHGLFVVFAVVFIVLILVCLGVIAISYFAIKKDGKMLKLKVIKHDLKKNKWTYVALIPFIVLLIMFCYVEAVGSISFSFFSYTMEHPSYMWNDFGNYIAIFNDNEFWLMFGNTFFFLVFDLILGIVPPIIFAFFLSIIKNKKLSGVLRALMFIPAIVPGIASLLIWRIGIFGDHGVLNVMTCFFRTGKANSPDFTPIHFLIDPKLSRWSLLLMGFPYVGGYLIFYGGLMNVPNEYHEAAQLEGQGIIKSFFSIDLPLIKPQIKYILVMGILSSAQNYERTYMLGSTGTTTLVESMYRQMKDYTNYGKASAYATIIFLLLLIPVLINFKDTKKTNLGDQI